MSDFQSVRIVMRIVICISVVLGTFNCATVSTSHRSAAGPAPLPSYRDGTTFVYADGRWETVIDVSPHEVTWIDHRDYVSSGSPDFTYRRSKWETKTRNGNRQFGPRRDLIQKSKLTLWPLQVGNTVEYSETGSWSDKDGTEKNYRTDWRCEVVGTEGVSVIAGDFDTWKIVCNRYYVTKSKSKSRLREVKTWYYAPEIGHYVLSTSTYNYDKKPRRRELLAVLPPMNKLSDGVRRQMQHSFQQALEFKKKR